MDDHGSKGAPIDRAPVPTWVKAHLNERQLGLSVGLQWTTLLWQAIGLSAKAKNVAQCLFIATVGDEQKKTWPSIKTLCARTSIRSETSVVEALEELADEGWILKEKKGYSREPAPERPGRAGMGYRLAWPAADCLTPSAGKVRCAQRIKGGLCTTTAGKGTTHPGTGPCWRHGGDRVNKADAEQATDAPETPQPVEHSESSHPVPQESPAPRTLQLLEQSPARRPVDNGHSQPPLLQVMLQPLPENTPTVDDGTLQRLPSNTPAVGVEYVREYASGVRQESDEGFRGQRAGVEDTPPRAPGVTTDSDSDSSEGLTVERAEQILAELPNGGRAIIGRARIQLAIAGRPEPTRAELVLAAASALLRRSA